MSRMTISSSASLGWPGRPRRLDHSPSCMQVPSDSEVTSQCWASVTPSPEAYSMARRMSRSSCTPVPSSVKIRTPSAASSPIGASCSPARPTVMAALVWTSHGAARPSSSTSRTTEARVDRWRRVRHGQDRGVAPERCGACTGLDGLGLLRAGLAEVRVQVDQTRGHQTTAGVDDAVPIQLRRRRRRCGRRRWPGPRSVRPDSSTMPSATDDDVGSAAHEASSWTCVR